MWEVLKQVHNSVKQVHNSVYRTLISVYRTLISVYRTLNSVKHGQNSPINQSNGRVNSPRLYKPVRDPETWLYSRPLGSPTACQKRPYVHARGDSGQPGVVHELGVGRLGTALGAVLGWV